MALTSLVAYMATMVNSLQIVYGSARPRLSASTNSLARSFEKKKIGGP